MTDRMMTEDQLRLEALKLAQMRAIHNWPDASGKLIVELAEVYLGFLTGTSKNVLSDLLNGVMSRDVLNGVMSINEARAKLGLPAIPGQEDDD